MFTFSAPPEVTGSYPEVEMKLRWFRVGSMLSWLLIDFKVEGANRKDNLEIINAKVNFNGKLYQFSSQGNGPISAFVNGMRENFDLQFTLEDFGQNTRSATSKAESAAYVELKVNDGKESIYGCGINTSITLAPILAVLSAINKIKF